MGSNRVIERGLLVSVWSPRQTESMREDLLSEFQALAKTAGVIPVSQVHCEMRKPSPGTFIGRGKAEEIAAQCKELGVAVMLIDKDLKPSQQRNLEELTGCKVVDRSGLILDIFAQRAKSLEGQIQVELAQLMYILPRLAGRGSLLSQLGGGVGTRGPGETKIEMDRRRIRERMTFLRASIEGLRRHRSLQRKSRQSVPLPMVTLVGYTNAGKSTLLNRLARSTVFTEDLLFATLDPTTRRVRLPHHGEILLTDTVGFIQDLSIHLTAAFKATLEEVAMANLLVHVVDASHHARQDHMKTVHGVLKQLGADAIPQVVVFNKADRLARADREAIERLYPGSLTLSASTGEGCDTLLKEIERKLETRRSHVSVRIPYAQTRVQALVHQFGIVEKEQYGPRGVDMEAWVDEKFASRLKSFKRKPVKA